MQPTTTNEPPAKLPYAPIVMILLFGQKLFANFPEIRLSAHWIVRLTREHLGWLTEKSAEVRAIDDDLETATAHLQQCRADFAAALANDPPAVRRRCLAALAQLQTAAAEVHHRTEHTATALLPALPPEQR